MSFYKRPASGGITWTEVTGTSQSMSGDNAYISNNASLVSLALPTTIAVGKEVIVVGKGAGGWRITQDASQQVVWKEGSTNGVHRTTTGTGGRIDSVDDNDAIRLVCTTANTIFRVVSCKGNVSLT